MSLTERPQLFIGGRWVDSKGGRKVDVHNPATGAYVGSTVLASTADIDAAVASARASFNSGVWANTPPEERAAVLH
ncbi:MAG UNVERIFIED_CONTAM: aldehyde dehydrogenase family protein, partial [Thermobifida fusca]